MDGEKTKNVILGLQEIEARFNSIEEITCDTGLNLLNVVSDDLTNLINVVSDDQTPVERKLFKKLKNVNHILPNSQRRNYVECRIRTFKKYLRAAFDKPKQSPLPVLTLHEVNTTFAIIIRNINKIPYELSTNTGMI